MTGRGLLSILLALALTWGCDESSSSAREGQRPDADATDGAPEDDVLAPDAAGDGSAEDALVDATPPPRACTRDGECGERGWCDEGGACRPAAEQPFVRPPADGATRAAAAAFDISPPYLERWFDRAGPDCPNNRAGRYDGRVDLPAPEDPCADGFDDTDGDGLLDAVWLAGDGRDRAALGVDNENPPAGRALVLARDARLHVLVALDLYAVDAARLADFSRRLSLRLGVPTAHIAVHTTGNRSGPDAVGLYGPTLARFGDERASAFRDRAERSLGLLGSIPFQSGTDEAWWTDVLERTAAAVRQAGAHLEPVTLAVALTGLPLEPDPALDGPIELPDADGDGVINDSTDLASWRDRVPLLAFDTRLPSLRDRTLRVVSLRSTRTGNPLVVLAGWGAAPNTLPPREPLLSADYPGVVRRHLEAAWPGSVAVWLTSAGADTVQAGGRAFIPEVDDAGEPVGSLGERVELFEDAAPAESPPDALGRLIATRALAALADAPAEPAALEVTSRFAWVPVTSPRWGLAARLGVMPYLRAWLTGGGVTNAWSSGATTPACGGLGCVRYRLDLVRLGPLALLTVPGGFDDAYVHGRRSGFLNLGDQRNLRDLDGDGVEDADDPEIRLDLRSGEQETTVLLAGPANPQRFPALQGLGSERIWLIGRTNGGVGSLRPAEEHINVFEGQLAPLQEYVKAPENAAIGICRVGYPCTDDLTLGDLVRRTVEAQPAVLGDLPGAHELWLVAGKLPPAGGPMAWRIEAPDGTLRAEGDRLLLGPGDRVFAPNVNLVTAGVQRGDLLYLPDLDEARREVGGVIPVDLSRHPNAGDAGTSAAADGGDFVYNAACDLLFEGACPHRRDIRGDDPNQVLPRTPATFR